MALYVVYLCGAIGQDVDGRPVGHAFEPCHRHIPCVLLVKQPK